MPTRRRRASRQPEASPADNTLGPLKSYEITGLFGRPTFHFELDKDEPTLLTGVNGTGKSTILRTIDAISSCKWHALLAIPFEKIVLTFEHTELTVERGDDLRSITITLGKFEPWVYSPHSRQIFINYARSDIKPIWAAELANYTQHEIEDVTAALNTSPDNTFWTSDDSAPPHWVSSISDFFSVLFVTDQRLIVDTPTTTSGHKQTEETSTRVAVDEAARHIWREIQRHKSLYATVAQELDSDFPLRVVAAMREVASPRSTLARELDDLADLRKNLEATGLLAAEDAGKSFTELGLEEPSVRAVVATYVRDTQAKLKTLEPLRVRLQLFTNFLNQHYSAKQVVIDQDDGFRIEVDSISGALPPARLSSGEQQMLVLAHRILFRTRPNTLVMIDEPELSLHVTWQATFIDDLARMGRVDNLTFLLATHSPTLIGGREDLKRSLDLT